MGILGTASPTTTAASPVIQSIPLRATSQQCYATCQNLAGTFQEAGMIPEICHAVVTLNGAIDCNSCLDKVPDDDPGKIEILANLEQFFEYCVPQGETVVPVTNVVTQTIGFQQTILTIATNITYTIGGGGRPITASGPATSTPAPLTTTSAQPISTQSTSPTAAPKSEQISGGIIVGAAVGATAAVALLGVTTFIMWRKRRQKLREAAVANRDGSEKPQLHSDCIETPKKYELHETVSDRAELPAPVPELHGQDVPRELDVPEERNNRNGTEA